MKFLIYTSDGPFGQQSRAICAIVVEMNYMKHFCEIIFNLDRRRCCLKWYFLS